MYVDPARVEIALRYAELAVLTPAERAKKNVEVTLFVASLWADATAAARMRYQAAVALHPTSLPWSALMKTPPVAAAVQAGGKIGSLTPTLMGPPVVHLLLGQTDPEDEGVEGYRLIAGEPRATAIIKALYAWDVPLLRRTADPSGWRLDAVAEPPAQPVDDGAEDDPEGGAEDAPVDQPADVPEPTAVSLTSRQKGVAVAGVAAGFALLGLAAWRLG
jgi:hypothetical protein